MRTVLRVILWVKNIRLKARRLTYDWATCKFFSLYHNSCSLEIDGTESERFMTILNMGSNFNGIRHYTAWPIFSSDKI